MWEEVPCATCLAHLFINREVGWVLLSGVGCTGCELICVNQRRYVNAQIMHCNLAIAYTYV